MPKLFFSFLILFLSTYLYSCKSLADLEKTINPPLSKTGIVKALRDIYLKNYKGVSVFETEKGLRVEIKDDVLFSSGGVLSSTGKNILKKISLLYKEEVVRAYPDNTFTVVGIQDGSGSEAKLKAERKAKVVMKELIRDGIPEDIIRSYGKTGNVNKVIIYLDLWQ
jgi:outer membrane protein OmpA-like peptidoglycan-associated protein